MSWVITAVAVVATSGAVSAYGQVQAGKAQEIAYKEQAEQEKMAAQSQELQRRQELNRALAANAVALSQAGITAEGTPASLALTSAQKAGLSEMTMDLSEKLRQAALKRQAKSVSRMADLQAAGTLLQSGAQIAMLKNDEK